MNSSLQTRIVALSVLIALLVTVVCVIALGWNSVIALRRIQVEQAEWQVELVDRALHRLGSRVEYQTQLLQHAEFGEQLEDVPLLASALQQGGVLDAVLLGKSGRVGLRYTPHGRQNRASDSDPASNTACASLVLTRQARIGLALLGGHPALFVCHPRPDGQIMVGLCYLRRFRLESLTTPDWHIVVNGSFEEVGQPAGQQLPGQSAVITDNGHRVELRYTAIDGGLLLRLQATSQRNQQMQRSLLLSVSLTGLLCAVLASVIGASVGLRWLRPIWELVERCRHQRLDTLGWTRHSTVREVRVLEDAIGLLVERLQRSRQELEHSLREQEQLEDLHSGFVRRILAELGQPLQLVLQAFAAMRREDFDRDGLLPQADHAAQELNDRLILLRGLDRQRTADGSSVLYHHLHLPSFCNRILRLVSDIAKRCNVTLELQLDPSLQHRRIDIDKLTQCLISLLTNAIQAPGCRQVHLAVRAEGAGMRFRISDNGTGMPDAIAKALRQASNEGDLPAAHTGFGLGLPLALAQLAQIHGQLELEGSDQQGTVISIVV